MERVDVVTTGCDKFETGRGFQLMCAGKLRAIVRTSFESLLFRHAFFNLSKQFLKAVSMFLHRLSSSNAITLVIITNKTKK